MDGGRVGAGRGWRAGAWRESNLNLTRSLPLPLSMQGLAVGFVRLRVEAYAEENEI